LHNGAAGFSKFDIRLDKQVFGKGSCMHAG
jgi:hypothetical protein